MQRQGWRREAPEGLALRRAGAGQDWKPIDILEVLPPAGHGTKPRRVWRVHYDYRQNGQRLRRKIKIGDTSSALSAIEARWREIKSAVDGGRDWFAEKQQKTEEEERARQQAYTFADLAHAYIERHAKIKKRSWRDDDQKLKVYILPRIGALKAEEVTKRHVISIIDYLAIERQVPVQADKTKALISSIFNWGRDEDLVQHNPTDRIRKRSERKRRTRLFSYEELRALWLWCERPGLPGEMQARTVIKLAILLGQRRNQIAAARKEEFTGLGSNRAALRIPHARNKNKDDIHIVPLPPLAEKLFTESLAKSGDSPFAFPSSRKRGVCLNAYTVTHELTKARVALGMEPSDSGEDVVFHGLRHMFKTEMNNLGIAPEIRGRIQSHRSKTATSDMDQWYDHADHYNADRAALDAWEKRLQEILSA